jgi:hypothetical protein
MASTLRIPDPAQVADRVAPCLRQLAQEQRIRRDRRRPVQQPARRVGQRESAEPWECVGPVVFAQIGLRPYPRVSDAPLRAIRVACEPVPQAHDP